MGMSIHLTLLCICAQGKYSHLVLHWKLYIEHFLTTSNTVLLMYMYATIEYVTHPCTTAARCAGSKMKNKKKQEILENLANIGMAVWR